MSKFIEKVIYGGFSGRRVEQPDHAPGYAGSIRVLQPADAELLKLLRRNLREIDARHLEQEDKKTWRDTKTDEQFRLVTSLVDPTAPEESSVTAFAVRGDCVCYLKPIDATDTVKSVVVGSFGGW